MAKQKRGSWKLTAELKVDNLNVEGNNRFSARAETIKFNIARHGKDGGYYFITGVLPTDLYGELDILGALNTLSNEG